MLRILENTKLTRSKKSKAIFGDDSRGELDRRSEIDDKNKVGDNKFDKNKISNNKISNNKVENNKISKRNNH